MELRRMILVLPIGLIFRAMKWILDKIIDVILIIFPKEKIE